MVYQSIFQIKFVTLGNILLERKNNCLILLSNDDKFATPPWSDD